jgi:hypothetical protein
LAIRPPNHQKAKENHIPHSHTSQKNRPNLRFNHLWKRYHGELFSPFGRNGPSTYSDNARSVNRPPPKGDADLLSALRIYLARAAELHDQRVLGQREAAREFLPVLPSDYIARPKSDLIVPRKVKTVRARLDTSGGKSLAEAPIIVEPDAVADNRQ